MSLTAPSSFGGTSYILTACTRSCVATVGCRHTSLSSVIPSLQTRHSRDFYQGGRHNGCLKKGALPGQPGEPHAAKSRSSAEQQVTEGGLVCSLVSSHMTVMQDEVNELKVNFRRGKTFTRQCEYNLESDYGFKCASGSKHR